MEQHSVARLIGAPPGYIGHEEGGQLTEAIRRRPYNVVLMDEVEKAHPLVLNVLLQVLDEGRLTDGRGRTVDFSNTVIILTSNVGSDLLMTPNAFDSRGRIEETVKESVMRLVRQQFRPEFLNRLDDILIFHPLNRHNLAQIVHVQMELLRQRLLEQRNIQVIVDPETEAYIGRIAYDPRYGARPLRRYLERTIVTQLSRMLVSGQLTENSTVSVSMPRGAPRSPASDSSLHDQCDLIFTVQPQESASMPVD